MQKKFNVGVVVMALAGGFCGGLQADEAVLPRGYLQLEWVMPRGMFNQYIQTDFIVRSTDLVEMDITYIRPAGEDIALWVARSGAGTSNSIMLNYSTKDKKFTCDFGNNSSGRSKPAFAFEVNQRYLITLDGQSRKFSINDVELGGIGAVAFTETDNPMKVFASEYAGVLDSFANDSYRLHSLRVTGESGELRLNLQPAYEKQSGLAGLYDTVSEHFYAATVKAGSYQQMCYSHSAAFGGRLPPHYRRMKSVTPKAAGYLNTLLTPLATDTMEMTLTFSDPSKAFCLWCSRGAGYPKPMMFYHDGSGKFTADCGNNSTGRTKPSVTIAADQRVTLKIDYAAAKLYLDGVFYQNLNSVVYEQGGSDLILFAACAATSRTSLGIASDSYWLGNGKFHSAKLTGADGTEKLKLIPCYEVKTATAGVFDLVSGGFFTMTETKSGTPCGFDYSEDDFMHGMVLVFH